MIIETVSKNDQQAALAELERHPIRWTELNHRYSPQLKKFLVTLLVATAPSLVTGQQLLKVHDALSCTIVVDRWSNWWSGRKLGKKPFYITDVYESAPTTPDHNTIWTSRERLTKAGAIHDLFVAFEGALRAAEYLPMGGQIVDATLVSVPRQRLTRAEKEAAQAGEPADAIWPGQPAKAARKDLNARWTAKTARRRLPAIAIPVFGYRNHVAIDRAWGFNRSAVTDAACYDGSMLPELVTSDNLAASFWADTTSRSAAYEAWLADLGRVSRIHRKESPGRPMPRHLARGNASKSAVRALVEHVFAHQKGSMGLYVRTIGLDRAPTRVGLASLAYNFQCLVFHERRAAVA